MMAFKIEKFFEKRTEKIKKYYPLVLRTGIAIVFLWFGLSQLKNPDAWTRLAPSYVLALSPFSATALIYLNGIVEIVLAVLLLLGLFTRSVSLLLTLHLLHITTMLGYGAIAARDFSLAIATFTIFLLGADDFSLDKLLSNRKENLKEKEKEKEREKNKELEKEETEN
ncbi:MAG: DoxX family membrane protein [Nanoarchaeota archaeon]